MRRVGSTLILSMVSQQTTWGFLVWFFLSCPEFCGPEQLKACCRCVSILRKQTLRGYKQSSKRCPTRLCYWMSLAYYRCLNKVCSSYYGIWRIIGAQYSQILFSGRMATTGEETFGATSNTYVRKVSRVMVDYPKQLRSSNKLRMASCSQSCGDFSRVGRYTRHITRSRGRATTTGRLPVGQH